MSTKPQSVHSIEEFRRLYYPEAEPTLDYFDGQGPDDKQPDDPGDVVAVSDPLDRFRRTAESAGFAFRRRDR
jgi:hypothetical protein